VIAAMLLTGEMGIASTAVSSQTPVSERVLWSSPDGTAQLVFGRNQRCSSGYVCLYEHTYWNRYENGRMLRFKDSRWQQLSRWGFNDETSSWSNRLGRNACLSKHWPVRAGTPKLTLEPGRAAKMAKGWNDQASGVKAEGCR